MGNGPGRFFLSSVPDFYICNRIEVGLILKKTGEGMLCYCIEHILGF